MPRRKPGEPPKPLGRPKLASTRQTTTLRIEIEYLDWIKRTVVPKGISMSDFVNGLLAKKIGGRR